MGFVNLGKTHLSLSAFTLKIFCLPSMKKYFFQRLLDYKDRWKYALDEKLIFRLFLDILLVSLHCWSLWKHLDPSLHAEFFLHFSGNLSEIYIGFSIALFVICCNAFLDLVFGLVFIARLATNTDIISILKWLIWTINLKPYNFWFVMLMTKNLRTFYRDPDRRIKIHLQNYPSDKFLKFLRILWESCKSLSRRYLVGKINFVWFSQNITRIL